MLRTRLTRLLAACVPLISSAFAAPGEVDFTFGDGGRVFGADLRGGGVAARNVAVLSDGRILVAGNASEPGIENVGLARYQASGAPDTSFNGTGVVITSVQQFISTPRLAVDGDERIIVVGTTSNNFGALRITVARFLSSGSPDTGFSGTGLVVTPIATHSEAFDVAVQADGKIVVVGRARSPGNGNLALVRYNVDGTLDTSFNGTGIVTTKLGFSSAEGLSVAIQSDGKIVVAGMAFTTNQDFVVARFLSTGALDTSFNGTGARATSFSDIPEEVTSLALQADGKIVVGGWAAERVGDTQEIDFALARYDGNGALDPSFGGDGTVTTHFGRLDYCHGVVVQGDGKIVAAGMTGKIDQADHPVLVRYLSDGSVDSDFQVSPLPPVTVSTVALAAADRILLTGGAVAPNGKVTHHLTRFFGGESASAPVAPVVDSTGAVPGEPGGTMFLGFGAPAVDGGTVGGAAAITGAGRPQTVIYGGDGSILVRTGGQDPVGAQFIQLGDPVFAGEALGFAGTALQPAATSSLPLRLDARLGTERAFSVRPGGKLAALYSQLSRAAGIKRLAAQADPAPGGGQFAKFGGFGLPRARGGLVFTGNLHRSGGVTAKSDFGVWREKPGGGESDLLLRHGNSLSTTDARLVKKLSLMTPVTGASDQRRSFAPDGGVAAVAKLEDGSSGVVRVAPDGSTTLPLETASAVPDEAGAASDGVEFVRFDPPATASGGRLALLAALKAAARGLRAPPSHAIFSNTDGTMRRVMARGDEVPGRPGTRWGTLGQPLLGQQGMIGLIAALTGRGVTPANRTAIAMNDNGVRAVVARLGDPAIGINRAVYRRFMSVVVTDSDPARLLFTATVAGKGVSAKDNVGLWSVSIAKGSSLVLRKGQTIMVGGEPLTVRTLEALQAPRKSMGQGRSTDASGFVTAKAKLSDGREGVLRIPLP